MTQPSTAAKPTAAQLRFILEIVRRGGTDVAGSRLFKHFDAATSTIEACKRRGWVRRDERGGGAYWSATDAARAAAQRISPDGYQNAVSASSATAAPATRKPTGAEWIVEGVKVVRRGEDEGPRGTVLEVAESRGFARVTFAGLEPLWIRLDRLSRADRWFGRVVSLCDVPEPHGGGHDWRSQGANYRCPGDRIDGSHRHSLVESGMSICEYGCKHFTCACNGLALVRHMASYGCPTGKAELNP